MAFVYLKNLEENKWFGEEQLSNSKDKRIFTFEEEELEGIKDMLEENGHGYLVEGELPYSKELGEEEKFFAVSCLLFYVLMIIVWVFFNRVIAIWLILLFYIMVGVMSFVFTRNSNTKRIEHELCWNYTLTITHKYKRSFYDRKFMLDEKLAYGIWLIYLIVFNYLAWISINSFKMYDAFIFLPILHCIFYMSIFDMTSKIVCRHYQFLKYEPTLRGANDNMHKSTLLKGV